MRAVALLLLLGGCATSSVVLLKGENGRPTGAVAVIDPKTGEDLRLVEVAGSNVVVAGSRSKVRVINAGVAEVKYKGILEYLPDPAQTFTLYFEPDSTQLTAASNATRDAMFAEITRRGVGVDVQIEGHTDRLGEAAYNDRLSLERAGAAKEMLVRLGLNTRIARVVGRGERAPIAGHEADDVADPVNRRVEVVVR